MKIQCDVCERAEATVLCCADEAALCWHCDGKVHAANKLASKHQRVPLFNPSSHTTKCNVCQEKAGYFFCLEDRALLCRQCDVCIHTATAYVASHQRFLVTGVKVGLHQSNPGLASSPSPPPTSPPSSHWPPRRLLFRGSTAAARTIIRKPPPSFPTKDRSRGFRRTGPLTSLHRSTSIAVASSLVSQQTLLRPRSEESSETGTVDSGQRRTTTEIVLPSWWLIHARPIYPPSHSARHHVPPLHPHCQHQHS